MSNLFDHVPEPIHHFVTYMHHNDSWRLHIPVGPVAFNNLPTMSQAVAFLASGHTIITNTYHGWYWGTHLGRRVVIRRTNNPKFSGLSFTPAQYENQAVIDWTNLVSTVATYPDALAECRAANIAFTSEVAEMIH